jgi:ketosteroid isomerase-like protein
MAQPDTRAMARDLVKGFADESGDMGTMDEALPPLAALLEQVAAPDFEVVMRGRPPTPPLTFPGVEGLAKGWNDYGEAFDEVRAVLEDIRESDTHLVLLVDQRVTTHTGGVQMSQPSAMLFEFNDGGQIARAEFHLDRVEALRVAGLEP